MYGLKGSCIKRQLPLLTEAAPVWKSTCLCSRETWPQAEDCQRRKWKNAKTSSWLTVAMVPSLLWLLGVSVLFSLCCLCLCMWMLVFKYQTHALREVYWYFGSHWCFALSAARDRGQAEQPVINISRLANLFSSETPKGNIHSKFMSSRHLNVIHF